MPQPRAAVPQGALSQDHRSRYIVLPGTTLRQKIEKSRFKDEKVIESPISVKER